MERKTCAIEDCNNPHKAHGWCRSHYSRWQKHGNVMAEVPVHHKDPDLICSVKSCERPVSARGYCKAHHNRWLRHGDVQADIPVKTKTSRNPDGKCAVEGCDRPQRARTWCTLHYERWRAFGDVRADLPNRNGRGFINEQGYRMIWVNGKQVPEHRVVMEKILNRRLTSNENVHHRNGQRADNRPENLELWAITQPYGQRVEDLVAWAWEIIERYDPDRRK